MIVSQVAAGEIESLECLSPGETSSPLPHERIAWQGNPSDPVLQHKRHKGSSQFTLDLGSKLRRSALIDCPNRSSLFSRIEVKTRKIILIGSRSSVEVSLNKELRTLTAYDPGDVADALETALEARDWKILTDMLQDAEEYRIANEQLDLFYDELLRASGLESFAYKLYSNAATDLDAYLDNHPYDFEARLVSAKAHYHTGNYLRSRELLEDLILERSYEPEPFYYLGLLYLSVARPSEAAAQLERAAELAGSKLEEIQFYLGFAYYNLRDYSAAGRAFETFLLDAPHSSTLTGRAQAFLQRISYHDPRQANVPSPHAAAGAYQDRTESLPRQAPDAAEAITRGRRELENARKQRPSAAGAPPRAMLELEAARDAARKEARQVDRVVEEQESVAKTARDTARALTESRSIEGAVGKTVDKKINKAKRRGRGLKRDFGGVLRRLARGGSIDQELKREANRKARSKVEELIDNALSEEKQNEDVKEGDESSGEEDPAGNDADSDGNSDPGRRR